LSSVVLPIGLRGLDTGPTEHAFILCVGMALLNQLCQSLLFTLTGVSCSSSLIDLRTWHGSIVMFHVEQQE
jgi:hypothetical protein